MIEEKAMKMMMINNKFKKGIIPLFYTIIYILLTIYKQTNNQDEQWASKREREARGKEGREGREEEKYYVLVESFSVGKNIRPSKMVAPFYFIVPIKIAY